LVENLRKAELSCCLVEKVLDTGDAAVLVVDHRTGDFADVVMNKPIKNLFAFDLFWCWVLFGQTVLHRHVVEVVETQVVHLGPFAVEEALKIFHEDVRIHSGFVQHMNQVSAVTFAHIFLRFAVSNVSLDSDFCPVGLFWSTGTAAAALVVVGARADQLSEEVENELGRNVPVGAGDNLVLHFTGHVSEPCLWRVVH
jgi:hypothetical protein